MSTITSPSRISKEQVESTTDFALKTEPEPEIERTAPILRPDIKLENRLNIKDLKSLQEAFMAEGDGYDNRLSLNRDQFCEALSLILNKGSREEFSDLFDKVDVTKDGVVDWDKFASHMLLEFYEKDDRVKSTQVPQWKDLKSLLSPHKEIIQRICTLSNNRYIAISKEGCVSMWGQNLKLQRSFKTGTDSCRARDLWVTNFVPLHNINKIALSFTSKEIAIYDLSTKMEFNCQYKIQGLEHTPLCLDYWSNPNNLNEAVLSWGDTGGCVNVIYFTTANISLFERPSVPAGEKQETCLVVQLQNVVRRKYKNSHYMKHEGHSEWVRQVRYAAHLECLISCATTWNNSVVIGWMEKHSLSKRDMKTTVFQITQGVNAFDYHEQLNLIATAGVNHHVCLWNPYVVSKPNGVLRGHMAGVVQVQFNKSRGQLISFSKDKVLRIWDVQLQVCIQRLAGMFPKGPEVTSILYYDDKFSRLFITFNYQLTMLEMRPEIKDRVMSHEKPVFAAIYNKTYNQVVTASQNGTMIMWMIDTGQKAKSFHELHGDNELTVLAQDHSETRIYTGSTDGTVKIWDFNGHCYHTLHCGQDGQPADVGHVLSLKRSVLVVGWTKYITVFRNQSLRDSVFHVEPSDWKGGQNHQDDILTLAFSPPNTLASGAYDGEIVLWNNSSEQASKHLTQRARKARQKSKIFITTRENTKISEGGFDSRNFQTERPRTRPKSRAASRISTGSNDESNEYGYALTRLAFLDTRKNMLTAANLVSCGGNGWVRFWNTSTCELMAEFVAHTQVGSIIMAVEQEENKWLVTGDVDGMVKVWDISQYCMEDVDSVIGTDPPPIKVQFQPHLDMINSLTVFIRNERPLILSSSSDCSVQLWDVYGKQVGIFGQESHWKIEPFELQEEEELEETAEEETQEDYLRLEEKVEVTWEPDEQATNNPGEFRMNVWDRSELGKDYQELRVQKRERRQPHIIEDLPYLHWERTGQPPAGPHAALNTPALKEVGTLHQPDFMVNPQKYFSEKPSVTEQAVINELHAPSWRSGLNAAYDEKTLFPKYILDFESKMRQAHAKSLSDHQTRAGRGLLKAVGQPTGMLGKLLAAQSNVDNVSVVSGSRAGSPGSRRAGPIKPNKLKPISVRSGSVSVKSSEA